MNITIQNPNIKLKINLLFCMCHRMSSNLEPISPKLLLVDFNYYEPDDACPEEPNPPLEV